MKSRSYIRLIPILLCGVLLTLCSCSGDQGADQYEIFGNGFKDVSPVVARVGEVEITRSDMQKRYEELPVQLKRRYSGEGWEDRFLRFMIDEALVYQGAVEAEMAKDPQVAQAFISYRRFTMNDNFKRQVLFGDLTASEEEIKAYYDEHPDDFVAAGVVRARHVECDTEDQIRAAWDALHGEGRDAMFAYVVGKFSVNEESKKLNGDLGWFNKGGYIGAVFAHEEFIDAVWDMPIGLNEPIKVADKWHIVEIQGRRPARPLSLAEAREQIVKQLEPLVRKRKLEEFLAAEKEKLDVEMLGEFAPGSGSTAEEIFKRGLAARDADMQIEIFEMLVDDYPPNEYTPKALFMLANLQLDRWQDRNSASKLLKQLIDEFPESDLVEQAQYMLENIGSRAMISPESVEDLRKLAD